MKLMLSRSHSLAFDLFTDFAGRVCLLSEGVVTNRAPTLILGPEHNCMVLNQWHVTELLPHLINFAHTGQLIHPLQEDWSI